MTGLKDLVDFLSGTQVWYLIKMIPSGGPVLFGEQFYLRNVEGLWHCASTSVDTSARARHRTRGSVSQPDALRCCKTAQRYSRPRTRARSTR
jgi:hypothetical protein